MTTALNFGLRRAAARLTSDSAPDGELLSRFLASRDEAAFALLVRRHAGMVFGTCRRVLGNAPDADDAFQAAFVMLVRKAHSLTGRACVGNFLYGVAFHTALKARAMATKRRVKEAKATRSESADSGELTRVLDEELSKLPDKYREPVVLCELDGVSRKDAASRLGIPEGTVSSRLATAHRMLAKRLAVRGFAAVAVAAVLGNQAFAVPEGLTEAAVRAATDGPPAGVTQLATEVSKMLLWNKLKAGVVLTGVLLACGIGFGMAAKSFADDKPAVKAPVPAKAEPKKDEDRIQGVWEAETVQVRGKQVPAKEVYKVMRWTFRGTIITLTTDDGNGSVVSDMAFALDATANPKTLAVYEVGAKKANAPHAIYELDGDTLKVCHNTEEGDAGPIPTSFRAGPKDKDELVVFKRVKDDKEQPAKKPDDAKLLQGKWVTKAVTWDPPFPVPPGAKHTPAQNVLTFTGNDLTWVTFAPDDVKTRSEQTKPYKLDQTTSPKELTSGDMECVYEVDGDTLTVAMYFLTPGRPKGFNAKDSPPGKGHIILIELTREKEEKKLDDPKAKPPEKKPEADKSYSLKDDEVLKLIAAPFPDEREVKFRQFYGRNGLAGEPKDYRMVIQADGADLRPGLTATSPDTGWTLRYALANVLSIDQMEVVADTKTLELPVNADTLVRPDTPVEKLLPALQAELKAKCDIDVTLEFKEMEREVVVASGTYLKRAGPNQVEPRHEYTLDTDEPKGKPNWGTHMFNAGFVSAIGGYVGRPVIDETNIKSLPTISFSLHEYHHTKPDDPKAKAPDPETVLKRMADQTGLTFKLEKRKVRALVVAKADPPKKDQPAWKAEFRKAYGLKDGQLVRRVATPFPDCRAEYLRDLYQQPKADFAVYFTKLSWKDGWPVNAMTAHRVPAKPEEGVPLDYLLDATLGFPRTRIEGTPGMLAQKVTGDWVVRAGADPEKAAGELEAILRKELQLPVGFSFKEGEEDVFVLSGKYALDPLDGKKAGDIEVYAVYRNDGTTGGGGSGTLTELAAALERYVGHKVAVEKVTNEPKQVNWHFNDRAGRFTQQEHDQDHDATTVLGNIAAQTGLTFKLEKRKVRVLVVDHKEVKKEEPKKPD